MPPRKPLVLRPVYAEIEPHRVLIVKILAILRMEIEGIALEFDVQDAFDEDNLTRELLGPGDECDQGDWRWLAFRCGRVAHEECEKGHAPNSIS